MVVPPDHRIDASPHAGLGELLATAARRLPDGALAVATGLGVVLGAAALTVGAPWRGLALAGLAAAAFGTWAILDRTLAEHGAMEATRSARLRLLALLLASIGWLSLGVFVLVAFGHVMDGVIH